MSISRNKHILEYGIVERQSAMKDSDEKSWLNLIKHILGIYGLPSILYLFDKHLLKRNGKKMLFPAVYSHTEPMWRAEINEKSSLQYGYPGH